MKIPIESFQKKTEYSINVYGALDVRLFLNKCLNVDLKNIEIWVSHGLKRKYYCVVSGCSSTKSTDKLIFHRTPINKATYNQ